jgi:hypothetical protein
VQPGEKMVCTPWPSVRGWLLRTADAARIAFWSAAPHRLVPVSRIRVSEALCGRCGRVQPYRWPTSKQEILNRRVVAMSDVVRSGLLPSAPPLETGAPWRSAAEAEWDDSRGC